MAEACLGKQEPQEEQEPQAIQQDNGNNLDDPSRNSRGTEEPGEYKYDKVFIELTCARHRQHSAQRNSHALSGDACFISEGEDGGQMRPPRAAVLGARDNHCDMRARETILVDSKRVPSHGAALN